MDDGAIALSADDQRNHLLLDLYAQLHSIGLALDALDDMAADPTYDKARADALVVTQGAIRGRIQAVKTGAAIQFPSDAAAKALSDACDALAKIDTATASAADVITAAEAVVNALPVDSTKP
jgi:hypothetical protein